MSEIMVNWLLKRASLTPNRIAIESENEKLTFKELNDVVVKRVGSLRKLGIKKNDHVGLLIKSDLKAIEIIHALEYLGAVIVFLNTRLKESELTFQLKDSEAKYLIYDQKYSELSKGISSKYEITTCSIESLITLKGIEGPINEHINLADIHSIIYTSGTTGNPKGVTLSYGNHWWSAIGSALNLGMKDNDKWLLSVPLFHVSGLSILMRSVISGFCVYIEDFDPQKINEVIKNKKITIISLVSIMLQRMLDDLKETYPKTLRCILLGGGFVPKVLLEECKKLNIPIFQTYGMTETASQIVTLGPEYIIDKTGSAGLSLFPAELKIMNEGNEAERGNIGEIIVRGPNVTKGYYKNLKATNELIKEGWLYTGDLGYVDKEGFLYVVDRRSDLIISGGENIYPAEIEGVLLKHPDILDVGVTGIENEKWGKVPLAFIKASKRITKEELRLFLKEKLANYKIPHDFYFVDNLPRNASNKLLRKNLLDLLK